MERKWSRLKERLRTRIHSQAYRLWIEPIRYVECSGDVLTLGCPNRFFQNWVRDHYLVFIQEELKREGLPYRVRFHIDPRTRSKGAGGGSSMRQVSLPVVSASNPLLPGLNPMFTFDQFVTGNNNNFAYSVARDFSLGENRHCNFVYFTAEPGLGKSHLCHAIGHEVLQGKPACRLHYLTMEEFINEMVSFLRNGRMNEFKSKYRRQCDILLLEEVHFLSGKGKTQEELAFTLDSLMNLNKRIVLTSSKPPREIRNLDQNLRSRLNSGLIVRIDPPEFDTRVKILEKKAKAFKLQVPRNVIEFLAEHIRKDVRHMESSLLCLNAKSTLEKRPLDLDLAREVVRGFVECKKQLSIEAIQEFVARQFNLSIEEMRSKSRKARVVLPRSIAMHLCRKYTDHTLEAIGKAFQRHHASVLYAINSLESKIRKNYRTRQQVEFIVEKMDRWLFAGPSSKEQMH